MCSTDQEVTDAKTFLISLTSVPSSNWNSSGFILHVTASSPKRRVNLHVHLTRVLCLHHSQVKGDKHLLYTFRWHQSGMVTGEVKLSSWHKMFNKVQTELCLVSLCFLSSVAARNKANTVFNLYVRVSDCWHWLALFSSVLPDWACRKLPIPAGGIYKANTQGKEKHWRPWTRQSSL